MTYDRPRGLWSQSPMTSPWKVERHGDGWAIVRRAARGRRPYVIPGDHTPLVFERQPAATIWAEILNEREAARAAARAARRD